MSKYCVITEDDRKSVFFDCINEAHSYALECNQWFEIVDVYTGEVLFSENSWWLGEHKQYMSSYMF